MFENVKSLFTGDWDTYHKTGIIPNIWAGITGQKSNEMLNQQNVDMANKNLDYQKALQQQIFEREDTSYQRTAEDMRAVGLNPLSMQGTNGSGEAIATTPPQNQMLPQNNAQMITSLMGIAQSINDVASGTYSRDALALENDRKFLENYKMAHDLKIDYDGLFNYGKRGSYLSLKNSDIPTRFSDKDSGMLQFNQSYWKNSAGKEFIEGYNAQRELAHKKEKNYYDSDSPLERGINSIEALLANPDTADRIKNLGSNMRNLLFGLLGF